MGAEEKGWGLKLVDWGLLPFLCVSLLILIQELGLNKFYIDYFENLSQITASEISLRYFKNGEKYKIGNSFVGATVRLNFR